MKKIESIKLSYLRNYEHNQFMQQFNSILQKYSAADLGIETEYALFKTKIEIENSMIRTELGNVNSPKLKGLDVKRDKGWNAVNLVIKGYLNSPFEDEVEAAEMLKRPLDMYGDLRGLNYNSETTAIQSLCDALLDAKNADFLTKLHLNRLVEGLQAVNKEFNTLFETRNAETSERESGDVLALRLEVDPLYRDLVDSVNATVQLKIAKPATANFVNEVNNLIRYNHTVLAARNGRTNDNSTPSEPDQPAAE